MPATVDAGDLLVMGIAIRLNSPTFTTPSGWTEIANDVGPSTFARMAIYAKVADGTEDGTTVDVATSSADTGAAQVRRVTGWYGSLSGVEAQVATGDQTNPDPPSITPSWGALDTLFIEWIGASDDDETVSAYSTNYSDGTDTISGAGVDAGAEIASAYRQLNATSEDPAAVTLSGLESWVAATVAIRPASALVPLRRRIEGY